ncbi:putative proteasome alpha 1 subunit [Taeniopygia guttata]|uniref:Putative proteasome alpha 1 subunit n=1 Tax=Taeniopygia guttata TaxID=59729 RepID=B5G1V5_TAEGU|nr:putative proteasome alpha 1 subunit [Taeniopygia guttata]ACH45266.1 putative proteasome alpha 1 subunit [Taeniopygia guttata]
MLSWWLSREHSLSWQLIRKKSCTLTTILVSPLLDLLPMQDSCAISCVKSVWILDLCLIDLFQFLA